MWLLDTNVVSEMRKPKPHGAVIAWLRAQPRGTVRVSSLTVFELYSGVEKTRRQDVAKAAEIERWIERMQQTIQVVSLDAGAARIAAASIAGRSGDLLLDAMIAAVAKVNGFTVVTRNVKDFRQFGVPLFDPFQYQVKSL